MIEGLINLPDAKWQYGTGRQPILKADFRDIEAAILQSFGLLRAPRLTWVDNTSIKMRATSDDIAPIMMIGFPSTLHPGIFVLAGLTDGRYRENLTDVTMDFDVASNLWGTEKPSQWYLIYAIAGNADPDFIIKAMPFMRFSSQASKVITLRNNLNSANIGYGFVTDELMGGKIYILNGDSRGLIRTITANNNDNGTGGTITYDGGDLTMAQGDWFVVLPPTNFRLVGEIFNNASSHIQHFYDMGSFIQWDYVLYMTVSGSPMEIIPFCSPLAKELRLIIECNPAGQVLAGHGELNPSFGYGGTVYRELTRATADITLDFCKIIQSGLIYIYAVGYRKPY